MSKYSKDFKFERNCPTCDKIITYKSYQGYETGLKRNSSCQKCGCGWMRGQTKETNKSIAKMAIGVSKANKGCIPWNKGLTKNEHPALKVIGDKRKGIKHTKESIEKISKASIRHWKNRDYRELLYQAGVYMHEEFKSEWTLYKQEVMRHTNKNDLTMLENIDKRGFVTKENSFHLDHKYSIHSGFKNNVDSQIIGSIYNLEMIVSKENLSKHAKNSISLKKLKKLYYG